MGGTMRWAELRMCRFWAGVISSFPFSRAREYRLLRRLTPGLNSAQKFCHVIARLILIEFCITDRAEISTR